MRLRRLDIFFFLNTDCFVKQKKICLLQEKKNQYLHTKTLSSIGQSEEIKKNHIAQNYISIILYNILYKVCTKKKEYNLYNGDKKTIVFLTILERKQYFQKKKC
jgi:hypothetical protein